nr:hypothetical protein [Tanacetum cinerariifolium]
MQLSSAAHVVLTTRPTCRPSLVSCLSLLEETLLSVTVIPSQSLRALPSLFVVSKSGSHVTAVVSGSVFSATVAMSGVCLKLSTPRPLVELSPTSYLEPRVDKHNLLRGGCPDSEISSLRSTGGGGYKDGGSGGDGNAARAVHLARRSLAKGGDSEVSGDGDGVGMARSLSTSASSGRDMEVCGQIVILAPMVAMSVEGSGMMGSVPSGGETSSSIASYPYESLSSSSTSSLSSMG